MLAAAGLLVVTPAGAAEEPCLEFETHVSPGDLTEVTVTDESWLILYTRFDRVYRITLSAVPETVYEIWSIDYGGWKIADECPVKDELFASGMVSGPETIVHWTDPSPGSDALKIRLPANSEPATITIELEELMAPPEDDVLIVPAVAHTVGARGELFQSDLVVYNRMDFEVTIGMVFVTGGGPKQRVEIVIGGHETVAFEDVVASVFGLDDAVGALRFDGLVGTRALGVVSRTYALTDAGTYGQFVPALPFEDAATLGYRGAVRMLPHLAKTDQTRSNVGFAEVLGLEADLDIRMVDETGNVLATADLTVPPLAHLQINDVFDFLGLDGSVNAALRVELTSHGRIFTYASVVDNRTSDPIFVPGLITDWAGPFLGPSPDQSSFLMVPAAASARGALGTRWRTDLRVVPSDDDIGELEVTFVPNNGSTPSLGTFDFIGPGPLAIDDVVSRLNASGSGHLRLRSPTFGTFLATSRTYSVDSEGSYGQFIPAEWLYYYLDHGYVLGLKCNADYRSNAGLVNPHDYAIEVELRLVSAAGESLGRRVHVLAPYQGRQLNDVCGAFGVAGCDLCRLEFKARNITGQFNLYIWGSVVDNRTGDAVFIPPIPF